MYKQNTAVRIEFLLSNTLIYIQHEQTKATTSEAANTKFLLYLTKCTIQTLQILKTSYKSEKEKRTNLK